MTFIEGLLRHLPEEVEKLVEEIWQELKFLLVSLLPHTGSMRQQIRDNSNTC